MHQIRPRHATTSSSPDGSAAKHPTPAPTKYGTDSRAERKRRTRDLLDERARPPGKTPRTLKTTLRQLTTGTCPKDAPDDIMFEVSLGGQPYGDGVYFHPTIERNGTRQPGAAQARKAWQILTPLRGAKAASTGLNRWLQRLFRERVRRMAQPSSTGSARPSSRSVAKRFCTGTKSLISETGPATTSTPQRPAYLANGEIGMVVGQYKRKSLEKPKAYLESRSRVQLTARAQIRLSPRRLQRRR